ncbi:hypothetical protein NG798_14680 [Ancylothrix sp. C2]|uniref:hypothetical protein n=1 Tax=Ancylothrix sp. D3o TaxID=2953691 RepID=UPI0021BB8D89|nr:hypothetical protein [Ancylothrix sp. D3o]MCT7951041.1 hypothetical protein [Ancylothrix sp. D3o]
MTRIPKQPRRYRFFFLNPYTDVRFSACPKCAGKTKLRKVPLVIEIEQRDPVILNKSCRYCPACDLLIAHQKDIEHELNIPPTTQNSEPTSNNYTNNYTITGTLDRGDWLRQSQNRPSALQLQQSLYSFKQVLKFEPTRWIKLGVLWKLLD